MIITMTPKCVSWMPNFSKLNLNRLKCAASRFARSSAPRRCPPGKNGMRNSPTCVVMAHDLNQREAAEKDEQHRDAEEPDGETE
jgi:hypothetical protein